ncbi:MAG: hypothetical protein KJO57_05560 [Deltaproteobacteria bacterium]|nr:hypothetical protein [Deltaproteobacteria bacterium]
MSWGEEWAGFGRDLLRRLKGPLLPFLGVVFWGLMWRSEPENPWYVAATSTCAVWFVVDLLKWARDRDVGHLEELEAEEQERSEKKVKGEDAIEAAEKGLRAMEPRIRDALILGYGKQRGDPVFTLLWSSKVGEALSRRPASVLTSECDPVDGGRALRFVLTPAACAALEEAIDARQAEQSADESSELD